MVQCSAVQEKQESCAGGRLGRFWSWFGIGGGGSALREVEPLELLVRPFLESTSLLS